MARIEHRVNVFEDSKVIGRVRYNANLDFWDGRIWSSGCIGSHKGLTKLKDGSYVLIYGSEFYGESDFAEIISEEEALKQILKSGNTELLELKKFKSLKKLMTIEEVEDLDE